MEMPHQGRDNGGSGDSVPSSPSHPCEVNLKLLQERDAEIQRLKLENREQRQRIDILQEQKNLSSQAETSFPDGELESKFAQLRRALADRDQKLREQDVAMGKTVQELCRVREEVTQAEQGQRDAEAELLLHHSLEDSDDDTAKVVGDLRAELDFAIRAQQQSVRRVHEWEGEIERLRDVVETLSIQLREAEDARPREQRDTESKTQHGTKTVVAANTKANDELDRWKVVAELQAEFLSVFQTQVETMKTDKKKMEHAVACCQRSADKRLLVLETDRQVIEADNRTLRVGLVSLQKVLKDMEQNFNEEKLNEASALEKLMRRDAEAHAFKKKLSSQAARVAELEGQLEAATTSAQKQEKELLAQFKIENDELLHQLEKRRACEQGKVLTQELDAVKCERDEFKARAAEWQTRWSTLTSVTLLQVGRLQRAHQDQLNENSALASR